MSTVSLVPGGPRLPSALLRDLEDERLVFFCGAGISIGTGLPNFRDLTLEAIQDLDSAPNGVPSDPAIADAFDAKLYDKALEILERKTQDTNRLRSFVAERLTQRLSDPDQRLRLHRAILGLARLRTPAGDPRGYRLVTTNYDDRFELAGLEGRWIEAAPHLSRPRRRNDYPYYTCFLHGRIETEADKRDPQYRDLVLTSADFGDAYMRNGFAARYVMELFREFSVVFIGYSINDPVMRYLLDIFATESRKDGRGQFNEAYAFADFQHDDKTRQHRIWEAKHVTPILYDSTIDHNALTNTMEAWAHLHNAGADRRFSRFMEITRTRYTLSQLGDLDTAVGVLLDRNYRTSEHLANYNPRIDKDDADISWLGPLLEADIDDPNSNSHPPSKCKLAKIEPIAQQLCRWAMRHLESTSLVNWSIANERYLISNQRMNFFVELSKILRHTKSEIKTPYRQFWLELLEIVLQRDPLRSMTELWTRANSSDTSSAQRIGEWLRHAQLHRPWPSPPFRPPTEAPKEPTELWHLARFEIPDTLGGEHGQQFRDLFAADGERDKARSDLAPYLDELTDLLLRVCRIGRRIEARFVTGLSHWERPSIQVDPGNDLDHQNLSWLLEAIVESFAVAAVGKPLDALQAALRWRRLWQQEEFALFGRLYLHATTVPNVSISIDSVIDDLLAHSEALWSPEYRAELLPLLRLRAGEASHDKLQDLIAALLAEPSADLAGHDIAPGNRAQRLAKLKMAGVPLDEQAEKIAQAYLAEHPPGDDPRSDEVSAIRHTVHVGSWGIGRSLAGKPIAEILGIIRADHDPAGWQIGERQRAGWVDEWLREEPSRFVEMVNAAIEHADLPAGAIDGVFWALSSADRARIEPDQETKIARLLVSHPDRMMTDNVLAISGWLQALATQDTKPFDDALFYSVWDKVEAFALRKKDDHETDAGETDHIATLTGAINSPGGKLTEALLDWFWHTRPLVGQSLPEEIRERLTRLIDGDVLLHLHARLICMQQLEPLFAVDPKWTKDYLLPRLSWEGAFAERAHLHWDAHLNYGSWSVDLVAAYREDFLRCLSERDRLDDNAFRFACQRFAELGIAHPGLLSKGDFNAGFAAMGADGAVNAIWHLERRLINSETPAAMWREMIEPWLASYWPPRPEFRGEEIKKHVARMILATKEAFPAALRRIETDSLVGRLTDCHGILWELTRKEPDDADAFPYAHEFPAELCRFLALILHGAGLDEHLRYDLKTIIAAIETSPNLPDPPPDGLEILKRLAR